jgi:hypothetical protein
MLFSKGCANAKRVQEAIVRQAILMKEKRSVATHSKFRSARRGLPLRMESAPVACEPLSGGLWVRLRMTAVFCFRPRSEGTR